MVAKPKRTTARSAAALFVVFVVPCALALAAGSGSLDGAFLQGDDYSLVVEHFLVRHPSWTHAWRLLTSLHGDLYQPLPMLSFQLNAAMAERAAGAEPPFSAFGFHLVNVLLHVFNTALAALLLLRLSRCVRAALIGAGLFACHPFAVEATAWVSGRMILLATTFSLAVLIGCSGGRRFGWARTCGVGLAWLGAVLSKVVPTVPIAAAWCDHRSGGPLTTRRATLYGVMLIAGIGFSIWALTATQAAGAVEAVRQESDAGPLVRAVMAFRYYVENYAWPRQQSAWSPSCAGLTLFSAPVLIGVIEAVGLLALALVARRRSPPAWTGIVLFVLLLLPFLGAAGARRLITADRYMYLPRIGLDLAVAGVVVQAVDLLATCWGRRAGPAVVGAVVLAALAQLTFRSRTLAESYDSTASRAQHAVAVFEDDSEARAELARSLLFDGAAVEALRVINGARARFGDDGRLLAEAGKAHAALGQWQDAVAALRAAVTARPRHIPTRYRLCVAMEEAGDPAAAQRCYESIITKQPDYFPARLSLAANLLAANRPAEAIDHFEAALQINPHHREARFGLAEACMRRGDNERAASLLSQIVEVNPADEPASLNLAVAWTRLGRLDEARALFERPPLSASPAPIVRMNYAALLVRLGQVEQAATVYRDLLEARPANISTAVTLHHLYQEAGRFSALVELWESTAHAADRDVAQTYLIWAYVLADRPNDASRVRLALAEPAAQLPFVRWAFAFDALRSGNGDALRAELGDAALPPPAGPWADDHHRIVLRALGSLPAARRESAMGYYALARALLWSADHNAARRAAQQVIALQPDSNWAADARNLLALLPSDR